MLRPLVLDLLALFIPLFVGTLAFAVGRLLHRLPRVLQIVLVAFVVILVAGGAATLAGVLPDQVGGWISAASGATVLLSWAALLLLGVAWSAPHRRLGRGFLSCIVALAGGLLAIEGSGALWWRFAAPAFWDNVPDAQGRLRQSSGLTCAPAVAAMLLHRHGIAASEGEMAYLAGTSLFGSDARQTARALEEKVRPHGWRAVARRAEYEECVGRAEPFLAHVQGPNLGHAVLVTLVTPELVEVVDPLEGSPKRLSRATFAAAWDGTVVEVVRCAD